VLDLETIHWFFYEMNKFMSWFYFGFFFLFINLQSLKDELRH